MIIFDSNFIMEQNDSPIHMTICNSYSWVTSDLPPKVGILLEILQVQWRLVTKKTEINIEQFTGGFPTKTLLLSKLLLSTKPTCYRSFIVFYCQ